MRLWVEWCSGRPKGKVWTPLQRWAFLIATSVGSGLLWIGILIAAAALWGPAGVLVALIPASVLVVALMLSFPRIYISHQRVLTPEERLKFLEEGQKRRSRGSSR
jgi:hypothetical protein